jgi:hypothetical protein
MRPGEQEETWGAWRPWGLGGELLSVASVFPGVNPIRFDTLLHLIRRPLPPPPSASPGTLTHSPVTNARHYSTYASRKPLPIAAIGVHRRGSYRPDGVCREFEVLLGGPWGVIFSLRRL